MTVVTCLENCQEFAEIWSWVMSETDIFSKEGWCRAGTASCQQEEKDLFEQAPRVCHDCSDCC